MSPDRLNTPESELSLRGATVLEPHGMCGGVISAVKFTGILLTKVDGREPVYTFNRIVHNHAINRRFEEIGLVLVEDRTLEGDWDWNKIPDNSLVVFSAHGNTLRDIEIARKKRCIYFVTKCPLVKNEEEEVSEAAEAGKKILYFGKPGHPEPRSVMSHAPEDSIFFVTSSEDVEKHVRSQDFDPNKEYVMANQTTISLRDIRDSRHKAIELIPKIDVNDRRGGCYATDNRQKAAHVYLARDGGDALLVVGSGDISNNTYNLAKVAWDLGKPAWIVNNAFEINWQSFSKGSNIRRLGLTSGASCSEEDFIDVFGAFQGRGVGIDYQEPVARERKTEFPIPAYKNLALLDARYA